MKANELRIGNLVKTYEHPEGSLITSITENFIDLKGSGIIEIQRIIPIPVTTELLKMVGFGECSPFHWHSYKLGMGYSFIGNSLELINDLGMSDSYFVNNVKYVHQLQNIYFAFTNKELQFENQWS